MEFSGGLTLWWKEDVDVVVKNYSRYQIDAWVGDEIQSRITLFYGSPYRQLRLSSWNLLQRLASLSYQPWLLFGDFNEVCFSWEVKGGKLRGEWQMSDFRKVLMSNKGLSIHFFQIGGWDIKSIKQDLIEQSHRVPC